MAATTTARGAAASRKQPPQQQHPNACTTGLCPSRSCQIRRPANASTADPRNLWRQSEAACPAANADPREWFLQSAAPTPASPPTPPPPIHAHGSGGQREAAAISRHISDQRCRHRCVQSWWQAAAPRTAAPPTLQTLMRAHGRGGKQPPQQPRPQR